MNTMKRAAELLRKDTEGLKRIGMVTYIRDGAIKERIELAAELERMEQAGPVAWIPASTPPQVEIGEAEHCWVTVNRKRDGTTWVWDVYYCNLPSMGCNDCPEPEWALFDDSGEWISMVGWADKTKHSEYDGDFYTKLDLELHDVIAWQPVQPPSACHEGGAA